MRDRTGDYESVGYGIAMVGFRSLDGLMCDVVSERGLKERVVGGVVSSMALLPQEVDPTWNNGRDTAEVPDFKAAVFFASC